MEFPSLDYPLIIAMKGLPCTRKTYMAASIAQWIGAPVFRVDDLLDCVGDRDEPEQLQRAAFVSLCKVAACQLLRYITNIKCVVIKSRLCSTFELDQLIDLAGFRDPYRSPSQLLIIECQSNNEYRWKKDYEGSFGGSYERNWYRPKEWDEVVKARRDYDAQAWDQYFLRSIEQLPHGYRRLVGRLVFNNTPDIVILKNVGSLHDPIAGAIKYLLTRNVWNRFQHSVEYTQLLQAQMEEELNTPRERRKYLCAEGLGCIFKYMEALEDYEGGNCGVCEKRILGPGYACHFCTLALHKSCAEDISIPEDYDTFPKKYACDSCKQGRRSSTDCNACVLQTNLKRRVMPIILKHDAHPQHHLSMCVVDSYYVCRGCGQYLLGDNYACKICQCFYHVGCVKLPQKMKHNHGGYEHVMKLMYSTDGMEEQEDFWCDACHRDINPEFWFFSCQECPYYVTHMTKRWHGRNLIYAPCSIR